jgi:DNA-binding transcriptional ArsR family regulator
MKVRLMRLITELTARQGGDAFDGEVWIDTSVCYDFVVSLRALLNPRTFVRCRRWSSEKRPGLDEAISAKARFLFQGLDTALGYGAARVIKELPNGASPTNLIEAVAATEPPELAMFMLDTVETSRERRDTYRHVLAGESSRMSEALEGLPEGWAKRCRQVLRDPAGVQADLVAVLEAYLSTIYAEQLDVVSGLIADAAPTAENTLAVLPASAAIERLTGGYTLGQDLSLRTVTLAPSVFMYPFVSARVDEETGEALLIYGVDSDIFDDYDPVPMRRELQAALKAMADPNRLTMLRLLAERPMYASELARRLKVGPPTVHHHVHQLRTARLIRQERDRNGMKYSIRTDSAEEILHSLEDWILGPGRRPIAQQVDEANAQ